MQHTTESIYKLFCCKLKPYIMNWVKSDTVADDIQQEVFIKIHEKIGSLKDDSKVKSWVIQIARNTILDYLKAQKNNTEEITDLCTEEVDFDAIVKDKNERNLKSELTNGLIPLIKSLPEKYSQALLLVDIEGLSQIDLAKKLNISVSGAKSRVQRGRKMVKDTLMNCCHYEFDKYGTVIDVKPKQCCCCSE